MKIWALFWWAVSRLKIKDGDYQKCLRNYILVFLMNLSGVKPKEIKALWYTYDNKLQKIDLA